MRPVILDRTIFKDSSSKNFIRIDRERKKFDIFAIKNSFIRFEGSLGKFLASSKSITKIKKYRHNHGQIIPYKMDQFKFKTNVCDDLAKKIFFIGTDKNDQSVNPQDSK